METRDRKDLGFGPRTRERTKCRMDEEEATNKVIAFSVVAWLTYNVCVKPCSPASVFDLSSVHVYFLRFEPPYFPRGEVLCRLGGKSTTSGRLAHGCSCEQLRGEKVEVL